MLIFLNKILLHFPKGSRNIEEELTGSRLFKNTPVINKHTLLAFSIVSYERVALSFTSELLTIDRIWEIGISYLYIVPIAESTRLKQTAPNKVI